MSTDFEKFIRKNRSEFDDATPSDKVWKHLERSLPYKEPRRFTIRDIYKWSAAAAIFFIILTSVYFLFIKSDPQPLVTKSGTAKPDDISSIAPEYAVQFNKVYQAVMNKQEELRSAASKQPELYSQFLNDLEALDSSYLMLRKQAAHTPNKDVIIKAMMQNLQLQAELLSRQLMIFNQFENTKKSNNETAI